MSFSILIGGDLVPTESNETAFKSGDMTGVVESSLAEVLKSADYRIFNLEVPLTDKEHPIPKCGPNLIAGTAAISGIKKLNVNLLTLANNHILDQDVQGLATTLEVLQKVEIAYVGAGENLREACKPYLIEGGVVRIGVYACTEHEFTIATDKSAGANPFDPLESLDHIAALKAECDYVIVLYHGGKEHYRYPSPYLQKRCRKMAQKGADLVVCQHSHCIGCYEDHEGTIIVYGQGNFLFDRSENEFWKTGLLLQVSINNGLNVDYFPIIKSGNGVHLATGQEAEKIMEAFKSRSAEILQEGYIEELYKQFAQENILLYLQHFAGFNKWLAMIDRRLSNRILKNKYNQKKLSTIQNFIECEAHRELVLAGLRGELPVE
jgi:poly-gamma-glutamate synthesis protein (capsule biosynthesis protein)